MLQLLPTVNMLISLLFAQGTVYLSAMPRPKKSKKPQDASPMESEVEVLPPEQDPPTESKRAEAHSDPADDPVEVLPADELEMDDSYDALMGEEDEPSAVTRYDPLSAYLKEIRRYPHLTPEEEKSLALKYYNSKDVEAAYRLVSSNLWLVVKIARDYERAARSLLDLIQEGNIGLMEAVKNFDPYRGVRFPSYAVWWIKAYIIRFVMANWRMVKIGTTQAQRKLFFNLKKEKDRLEKEGFFPSPKLLAERLQVKESEVLEMEQRLGGGDVSVDAPLQQDADGSLLSVLHADASSAEEILANKESKDLIAQGFKEFAGTLNSKEAAIFESRLLAEDKATLQDLSERLSLSRERVRQIENRLKEKLKNFLLDRYGSAIKDLEL